MELTRKQVIDLLEKADSTVYKEPKTKLAQALEYAISSIKTDETYQLMYEGAEVYDKDTVARMLIELKLEIGKMSDTVVNERTVTVTSWKGMQKKICNIIQQKIDVLKGEINDKQ